MVIEGQFRCREQTKQYAKDAVSVTRAPGD